MCRRSKPSTYNDDKGTFFRLQYSLAVFVGFLYSSLLAVPGLYFFLEYSRQARNYSKVPSKRRSIAINPYQHYIGWRVGSEAGFEKLRDTIGRSPSYRVASRCFEKFTPCPNTSHPALLVTVIDDRRVNENISQFLKRDGAALFCRCGLFLFYKRMSSSTVECRISYVLLSIVINKLVAQFYLFSILLYVHK